MENEKRINSSHSSILSFSLRISSFDQSSSLIRWIKRIRESNARRNALRITWPLTRGQLVVIYTSLPVRGVLLVHHVVWGEGREGGRVGFAPASR